eukprot:116905-Lingulodinium_polyedra.AAC.1
MGRAPGWCAAPGARRKDAGGLARAQSRACAVCQHPGVGHCRGWPAFHGRCLQRLRRGARRRRAAA